ncbi:hypothetical protein OBBRIDRAFT_837319 [Obba rivulosa]|uniref:DUF4470 domain-containing protein n=1 Tax=Obba rivulosa TaxID=1052685 RepID=A0A8E2ASC7_9APHY|nr:hypothetical protein OBBRIDRAFT_837319 [Obba rivulosa]
MSEDAKDLKDRANVLFKRGRAKESATLYAKATIQAEELDPTEPVYPSNLSAALFEAGDYAACSRAILRSWKLIQARQQTKPELVIRLATRLAKALSHGARAGAISPKNYRKQTEQVKALETAALQQPTTSVNAASYEELTRVWQEWRQFELMFANHAKASKEGLKRLASLPVFTLPPDPLREYYSIGMDKIIDMFEGWGPQDKYPIDIDNLPVDRLSQFAFMFGGVGDARHVFGTIAGSCEAFFLLSEAKRPKLRVHMTLLDIHPATLARDLIMFRLLSYLVSDSDLSKLDLWEIHATLMYTYGGVVMPAYCFARLQTAIQELRHSLSKSPQVFPWLYVASESIPPILEILQQWTTMHTQKPVSGMLEAHKQLDEGGFVGTELFAARQAQEDKEINEALDNVTDEDLLKPGWGAGSTAAEARQFFNEHRADYAAIMYEAANGVAHKKTMRLERPWYKRTKVFFPPPALQSRHPGFSEAAKQLKSGDRFADESLKKIKKHVKRDWVVNVTLLEKEYTDRCLFGFPPLELDALSTFGSCAVFARAHALGGMPRMPGKADQFAYKISECFFNGVADALKIVKDRVMLEFVCGGITEELTKMRAGVQSTRPASFPTQYTRMWLSNVPDYIHGPMNLAIYVVPSLQPTEEAAVACNILLNTGSWGGDDDLFHNYTLLRTKDIPRYLGCNVVQTDVIWTTLTLTSQKLPRSLSELASHEELFTWLTRVLLCTILPGQSRRPPQNVRMPHNLVAFTGLLMHLHTVGFPGHWLSEYLKMVLSGSMVTDVAPYKGLFPIPVSEVGRRVKARKIRLDPWVLDFENVIAAASASLPFPLPTTATFSSEASDLVTLEASVKPAHPHRDSGSYMDMLFGFGLGEQGDAGPSLPVIHLLFFKGPYTGERLLASLDAVLEGKAEPAPGHILVLTSPEAVDCKNSVRWRMSERRMVQMQEEEWNMLAFRNDNHDMATHPVPASQWHRVISG